MTTPVDKRVWKIVKFEMQASRRLILSSTFNIYRPYFLEPGGWHASLTLNLSCFGDASAAGVCNCLDPKARAHDTHIGLLRSSGVTSAHIYIV